MRIRKELRDILVIHIEYVIKISKNHWLVMIKKRVDCWVEAIVFFHFLVSAAIILAFIFNILTLCWSLTTKFHILIIILLLMVICRLVGMVVKLSKKGRVIVQRLCRSYYIFVHFIFFNDQVPIIVISEEVSFQELTSIVSSEKVIIKLTFLVRKCRVITLNEICAKVLGILIHSGFYNICINVSNIENK